MSGQRLELLTSSMLSDPNRGVAYPLGLSESERGGREEREGCFITPAG